MTQPTMRANLLQTFEVITKLRVDAIGEDLRVLSVDNVLLPVEEPRRDFVLRWVLDDCDDAFEFVGV